jgi:hypothetical protein
VAHVSHCGVGWMGQHARIVDPRKPDNKGQLKGPIRNRDFSKAMPYSVTMGFITKA